MSDVNEVVEQQTTEVVNAPGRDEMPVENRPDADTNTGKTEHLSWGARSDVGLVRGHNEDSFLVRAPLFAVCDGMGGHAAGEVASRIAVETIAERAPEHADEILLRKRMCSHSGKVLLIPAKEAVMPLDLLREADRRGIRLNVIILSAKDSVDDKVAGLRLGADDYLPKPFHISELLARIQSLMRRVNNRAGNVLQLANLSIDTMAHTATVNGRTLDLSRKEYDILLFLASRKGHMVEKQTLAEAVWGDFIDQADHFDFIYAHIKNLRKRLKESGAAVEIKTTYGFGYRLIES